MKPATETALVPVGAAALVSHALPATVARAGGNARFAYDEFFKASIGNAHTRPAYARIVDHFPLWWCICVTYTLHSPRQEETAL